MGIKLDKPKKRNVKPVAHTVSLSMEARVLVNGDHYEDVTITWCKDVECAEDCCDNIFIDKAVNELIDDVFSQDCYMID